MPYDLNNPHPKFGKDPNILNEFGNTEYPKYVIPAEGASKDKNGLPHKVLVQDAEEEAEITGKELKAKDKKKGWSE